MHELLVAADLLSNGFEVLRALSPGCSCDLAILKGDRLIRVQVTTGYRNKITGKQRLPKRFRDAAQYDLLAIVIHGEKAIAYKPALAELINGTDEKILHTEVEGI